MRGDYHDFDFNNFEFNFDNFEFNATNLYR